MKLARKYKNLKLICGKLDKVDEKLEVGPKATAVSTFYETLNCVAYLDGEGPIQIKDLKITEIVGRPKLFDR